MANKTVRVIDLDLTGRTGLKAVLKSTAGAPLNGSGDNVTESATGVFDATVAAAVAAGSWYIVDLFDSGGVNVWRNGWVYFPSDAVGVYIVDDPRLVLTAVNAIAGSGAGSGARAVTITVTSGGQPVIGARVRVTLGAESYVADTNGSGQATFNLNDGTWTVAITKSGFTFAGASLVVAANVNQSYAMTALTITPAPSPGLCTVAFWIQHQGNPVIGASIDARLVNPNSRTDGVLQSDAVLSAVTNSSGYAELVLVQSAAFTSGGGVYRIRVVDALRNTLHDRNVTIPAHSTANAEDLPDAT